MHTSTITSKGQVTIPVEMRKILGLDPGKRVAFRLEDGHITLEAVRDDITAAFGMLKADRHISIEEMKQAIAESATSRCETGVVRNGK
jgi:antitoxin PrlF